MFALSTSSRSIHEWHEAFGVPHVFAVVVAVHLEERALLDVHAIEVHHEHADDDQDGAAPVGEREPDAEVVQHATGIGRMAHPPIEPALDDLRLRGNFHLIGEMLTEHPEAMLTHERTAD